MSLFDDIFQQAQSIPNQPNQNYDFDWDWYRNLCLRNGTLKSSHSHVNFLRQDFQLLPSIDSAALDKPTCKSTGDHSSAHQDLEQPSALLSTQTKTKKESYNTMDYIIKQSVRSMLSLKYQSQVQSFLSGGLSYQCFIHFWKKETRINFSKHVGINRFAKLLENQSESVLVARRFLVDYLWHDYPEYVARGSMENKGEYMRCATKLMYISVPQGRFNIKAQN